MVKFLQRLGCSKVSPTVFSCGDKKIEFADPPNDSQLDSFFYDGFQATVSKGNRKLEIYAVGDIEFVDKRGEKVYDLPFDIKKDSDLNKITRKGYDWEHNNWFSIKGGKYSDDFHDTMDEAVKTALDRLDE